MNRLWFHWAPAMVLTTGALLTVGVDTQREMPLRAPLDTAVPLMMEAYGGSDVEISAEEQRVAGMSSYVMRVYKPMAAAAQGSFFSVYVGYYTSQEQGRTIHSPKNCLPGGGWEPLQSRTVQIAAAGGGAFAANQYLLQREDERALVLYWYQGRGRIEANEYRVKWDLLRDAALRGRSDEALVRIVVPVTSNEKDALELASRVARTLAPAVDSALPS